MFLIAPFQKSNPTYILKCLPSVRKGIYIWEGVNAMLNFKSIIMFAMAVFVFCQISYASETSPEPGGVCNEPDTIYNYSADIDKTQWKPKELYAVPVGTTDPLAWEQSSDFRTQFMAALSSGESAEAFAQACTVVWQNFFSSDAAVVISVSRTITSTHKTLKCISGTWNTIATEDLQLQDVSDWLTTNSSAFNVTNSESATVLKTDIENILTNLNAQPGAN
jgi:hypothetical protein